MKKNILFRKFYLINVVTVLVSLFCIMLLLSASVGHYLTEEKRTLLSRYCNTFSGAFSGDPTPHNDGNLHDLLTMGQIIDADVFIVDGNGKVMACSCEEWAEKGECQHTRSAVSADTMAKVLEAEFYEVGTLDGMYTDSYHTVGVPLRNRYQSARYGLFASAPASALEAWLHNFSKSFILCAILPLLAACVVIYLVTYRMLRPLMQMKDAAGALAKGDFSRRIYYEGNDEIADLAKSFNQMTNSLVQLETMRRSFVANVSHELRTPMTTIGGFIDGILDGTIEPSKQHQYLEIVSEEVKRLSGLVQSMLSLARLESGQQEIKRTEVDLHALTCSVLISQEQRIGKKGLDVCGLEEGEHTMISVDADLFYQVIYNLTDNAIKFSPEGGRLDFFVGQTDNGTCFKVRNQGEGIEEADLPHVFDRFYKVDKSRSVNKQSSGLGLYIVKSIVDLHGGTVTVRSAKGEYTEFEVVLPNEKREG